ncbi:MAG: hypothetical protein M3P24_07680, partial [Gemmatimonadota bacterium]|nr:hypothetical protein [Gemmatimonadota bacterium]
MRPPTIVSGAARGAVVASLVALSACAPDQLPTNASPDSQPSLGVAGAADFVPGEVIVKFRAGTSAEARAAALYAAYHSGASAATIKNAIMSSAVPTASLNG